MNRGILWLPATSAIEFFTKSITEGIFRALGKTNEQDARLHFGSEPVPSIPYRVFTAQNMSPSWEFWRHIHGTYPLVLLKQVSFPTCLAGVVVIAVDIKSNPDLDEQSRKAISFSQWSHLITTLYFLKEYIFPVLLACFGYGERNTLLEDLAEHLALMPRVQVAGLQAEKAEDFVEVLSKFLTKIEKSS